MRFALPLLTLLVAAGPARAHPHNPPTVCANVFVGAHEVVCKVAAVNEMVEAWLAQGAEKYFHEHCPVTIDGTRVAPLLRGKGPPDGYTGPDARDFLELTFAYPCDKRPRSVGIRWGEFEGASWQGQNVVPLMIKAGSDVLLRTVEPGEPEFVWHAAPGSFHPHARPKPVTHDEPGAQEPASPVVSIWILACGGLLAIAWLVLWHWFPALVVVLVTAAGACAAWPAAPGPRGFEMPTKAQARKIFAQLQKNIYDAFDAETEDQIYDLLAVSVSQNELDDLYADVYESLIMREQGGAVTQVEKIDVLEGDVTLPRPGEQEHRFFVDWKWRVHCAISHWGHTHRRVNEYHAKYTVEHDAESWKIAGVDVLEQKRLDLDVLPQPEPGGK